MIDCIDGLSKLISLYLKVDNLFSFFLKNKTDTKDIDSELLGKKARKCSNHLMEVSRFISGPLRPKMAEKRIGMRHVYRTAFQRKAVRPALSSDLSLERIAQDLGIGSSTLIAMIHRGCIPYVNGRVIWIMSATPLNE
ncbi:hypothetical protein [Acetobacter cibinongensis]|uniref:Uncharacterized protein n=1 Tax=Acetobacter cibinongensis TaxID=146475 RepID=A0A1Z5YV17_9PROT|nr:hypothetical protein [Acetobacter cibinongensis]OUJ02447.1 hypothetical protein HK14_06270 [Acetobacter cibinongensis]